MQLFRGYVPTKDKQCLEKFKGRKRLNTLEEVQDLDEYAAILGDETILIDVDNAETSDFYSILFRTWLEMPGICDHTGQTLLFPKP